MKIYKLQYQDKETAQSDLLKKGVYVEAQNLDKETTLTYGKGIHAVVEIGLIVDKPATFDDDFNIITEPIYFYGYHYDVMSEQEIIFENAIEVNNPKYTFAKY